MTLPSHEKDVARYILSHMDQIPDMSASQLAKASLTSKATVVRLGQKLGLSGYQEFKLKLVAEINQDRRSASFLQKSRLQKTVHMGYYSDFAESL